MQKNLVQKLLLEMILKRLVKGLQLLQLTLGYQWGQEDEKEKRVKDFDGYIVDKEMMKLGASNAIFFTLSSLHIEVMKYPKMLLKVKKA